MTSIILPKNIEVVVASSGGCGTTMLIEWLSRYRITNHSGDRDGLKHLPIPPVTFNRRIKFIYLYGDPVLSTVSLFRQGYHHPQSIKLQRFYQKADIIDQQTSLEEYAKNRQDKLQLERQFLNWHETYLSQPTLFIRLETIWDNLEPLLDFLGISRSVAGEFPRKNLRVAAMNIISQEMTNGLNCIYGDFAQRLNKMAPVELRDRCQNKIKVYSSSIYRRAWLDTQGGR